MKTLNLYVTQSFIVTFVMSIGILTFGMLGGRLIKIIEIISTAPLTAVLKFILYISPLVLSLSIPFAVLVSVMLVFGRLSADSEITAMRACGISVLQIISPIILMVFFLTCFCLYLQLDIVPYSTWKARNFITQISLDQPTSLLQPGRTIEYKKMYRIYIDSKENDILKNIQVFVMSVKKNDETVKSDITAPHGRILVDNKNEILQVVLYDATIVDFADGKPKSRTFSKEFSFSIDYGKEFNELSIAKDESNLSFREIFGRAVMNKRSGKDNTKVEVELNQRIALALAPIAFMLLGMPLAIRTSRRETSIGLFLSVILGGIYVSLVMICRALSNYPQYYPQALLWIPCISYQICGAYFIFKIARR